jgi:histidinol-phosphate aminotransferase
MVTDGTHPSDHGGTDAGPPVHYDFSTNAHPLGPPPAVLDAVLAADRQRYPDPTYTALRAHLADWHAVSADRVLPTAGGAEAIRRISLAALLAGVTRVCVPQPGFGDYQVAALTLGLAVVGYRNRQELVQTMDRPCLVWICDPCNPTGSTLNAADWAAIDEAQRASGSHVVVDQAYEPLRLRGASSLPPSQADRLWRLICPNKALGLTGVRAAYLLAPVVDDWRPRVQSLAASWVLAAEGEALLRAWAQSEVQEELAESHRVLLEWAQDQQLRLATWGFEALAGSVTPFWMARLPELDAGTDLDLDPALDLNLDLGAVRQLVLPTIPPSATPPSPPSPIAPPPPAAIPAMQPARLLPTTPAALLQALRLHGIKLRDASSFGYPGWVRLSVQTPQALLALMSALHQVLGPHHVSRRRSEAPSLPPTLDSPEDPA